MNKKHDQWFYHKPPRSLTDEEREKWIEEAEWERQEYERRMEEGMYPYQELPRKKVSGWKLIQKLFKGK
tara:strand:+ start:2559 stop:2765 length:207 start_codon:yes stop_codon:yes gene_type:complete